MSKALVEGTIELDHSVESHSRMLDTRWNESRYTVLSIIASSLILSKMVMMVIQILFFQWSMGQRASSVLRSSE